jgi:hypothetical protein
LLGYVPWQSEDHEKILTVVQSLGGLFFQSSTGVQISQNSRREFLAELSQAHFIPHDDDHRSSTPTLGNIDEYTLEESPTPKHESDLTLGSVIEFSQWLYRVKEGKFFPTFYFPSTFAGPDIVFCLKSKMGDRRILCAIQVRDNEYR